MDKVYTSRMAHHAYLVTGDIDRGIAAAFAWGERELGLNPVGNPDVVLYRYGLFPVEDARRVVESASRKAIGERKLIVIAAERLFHESQNALLKVFEEPPEETTLILVVPAEGVLLPTMRSRLLALPGQKSESPALHPFIEADADTRAKMVSKLLDHAKSDKDEEKQAARAEALHIVEDLMRAAYFARGKGNDEELTRLLYELDTFTPILHERSAPLKLIFEHLLLVTPVNLVR